MLRSMTGFGSAERNTERGSVSVEVRSVNSRHLDVRLRLPAGVDGWEGPLRELVGEHVARGRVELAVKAESAGEDRRPLELDRDQVESYLSAFQKLREEYSLPGRVDLPLLVRAGGLLRERRTRQADWLDLEDVEGPVREALEALQAMREEEGERLAADFGSRLDAIEEGLEKVARLAPERLERERERLRSSVQELVEELDRGDEDRIAREIALLADKWDVGEELTRAKSHVQAFREYLERPRAEPVGKRLKFLAQELHREINTMGAKGNDAEISREVVEMKNELEAIREQIENVE